LANPREKPPLKEIRSSRRPPLLKRRKLSLRRLLPGKLRGRSRRMMLSRWLKNSTNLLSPKRKKERTNTIAI
jgi:hypothetical protein